MHFSRFAVLASLIAAAAAAPQGQSAEQGTATNDAPTRVAPLEPFHPSTTPSRGKPVRNMDCWTAVDNVLDVVYPNWRQLTESHDNTTRPVAAQLNSDSPTQWDGPNWISNQTGQCTAGFLLQKSTPVTVLQMVNPFTVLLNEGYGGGSNSFGSWQIN